MKDHNIDTPSEGEDGVTAEDPEQVAGETEDRRRVREELVLAALIAGLNDRDAAAFAGCSMRTVRRHREDPAFKRKLADGRRERMNELSGSFIEIAGRARDTLVAGLDSDVEAVRMRAADVLLKWAHRLHHTTEIDIELGDLQAQLEEVTAALEAMVDPEGDGT
jgi:hypothetical protein